MSKRFTRAVATCVLALGLSAPIARADEPAAQKAAGEQVTCSCKACTPDVCCKAPTGFQPLDDKCKSACGQKTWSAASQAQCGTQQGCCP